MDIFKPGDVALDYSGNRVKVLSCDNGDYTYELLDKSGLKDPEDDGIFTGNFLRSII
jgi:hypothetical protein